MRTRVVREVPEVTNEISGDFDLSKSNRLPVLNDSHGLIICLRESDICILFHFVAIWDAEVAISITREN